MKKSVYQRPDKPKRLTGKIRNGAPTLAPVHLADVIEVDRFTECHVTPLAVGERMANYLDIVPGASVLEPQAGTGNLVQSLLNTGCDIEQITAVERHCGLAANCQKRFAKLHLITQCFLAFAEENLASCRFDYILMNPPFKHTKAHVDAALRLLSSNDNACLVALVPVTFDHPEAMTLERLSADTFANARVFTKIIRIEN